MPHRKCTMRTARLERQSLTEAVRAACKSTGLNFPGLTNAYAHRIWQKSFAWGQGGAWVLLYQSFWCCARITGRMCGFQVHPEFAASTGIPEVRVYVYTYL